MSASLASSLFCSACREAQWRMGNATSSIYGRDGSLELEETYCTKPGRSNQPYRKQIAAVIDKMKFSLVAAAAFALSAEAHCIFQVSTANKSP